MTTSSANTRPLSVAFWAFITLTFTVYLAIVLWSAPTISGYAGGLVIFDLRPTGYDYETAQAFLDALSVEGRQFYLSVQHRLDLIYPPLLAITLVWAIDRLTDTRRTTLLLAVLPLIAMVADLLENAAVAALLEGGSQAVTAEMVSRASWFTVVKSGATTVAMTCLLLLILRHLYRSWVKRNGSKLFKRGQSK
jgi:hypothetical protein